MQLYKQVERKFLQLSNKGKLAPLINHLDSVYLKCTYSHGQHTSRSNTCYSQHHQGMMDHLIFNNTNLKVLQLLEIPAEKDLAPKDKGFQGPNFVSLLPNVIFPSDHLRIEAEFEIV